MTDSRHARLLAHPLRAQIVAMIADGELSPVELTGRLNGPSMGVVAYHVRTLAAAGVLRLQREAPVRGAVEHFYAVHPDAADTLREVSARFARAAGRSLEQIAEDAFAQAATVALNSVEALPSWPGPDGHVRSAHEQVAVHLALGGLLHFDGVEVTDGLHEALVDAYRAGPSPGELAHA